MVVCVHCSTPTKELLLSYGPDHVVCTRCQVCGLFADPYVEQEAVIVAIDLILVKPRAYRHLLFNRPYLHLPCYDNKNAKEKDNKKSTLNSSSSVKNPSTFATWWTVIRQLGALFLIDSYLRWYYLCASDSATSTLPTALTYQSSAVRSYFHILFVSSLQLGTLFLTSLVLSMIYHRVLVIISQSATSSINKEELLRFKPHTVVTSLLLANMTPIFLLCLLLLWHSNSSTTTATGRWQWDDNTIDQAIRSLVGGLSSGVALGVALPLQKSKIGALVAISILLIAWTLQMQVTTWLQLPFHSGIGVLQTPIGIRAAQMYCR